MDNPFAGIEEKLKRSHEHIGNLEVEVKRFFEKSDYPILPQDNNELLLKAIEYHRTREIPLRFSVLAGEIAHHLRSILDHIVWVFSSTDYRDSKEGHYIEFPILESTPGEKSRYNAFDRKIKGVSDPDALKLINDLQPCNTTNALSHPLLIIHKMDITDKHRELVLCFSSGGFEVPYEIYQRAVDKFVACNEHGTEAELSAQLAREMKSLTKIVATISFRDFGGRELQPIVPALVELHNFITRVTQAFADIKFRKE
jgi:hypothetical protein